MTAGLQSANEREGGCGDCARIVRASVPSVEEYTNTGIGEARRGGAAVVWEVRDGCVRTERHESGRCASGVEGRGGIHLYRPDVRAAWASRPGEWTGRGEK